MTLDCALTVCLDCLHELDSFLETLEYVHVRHLTCSPVQCSCNAFCPHFVFRFLCASLPFWHVNAELVERPTLFSCRYKIPHQDGMNLADVFGHFEAAKAKVHPC